MRRCMVQACQSLIVGGEGWTDGGFVTRQSAAHLLHAQWLPDRVSLGAAQAHAILGIGPDWFDIFGDDKKSDLHHPRPDAEVMHRHLERRHLEPRQGWRPPRRRQPRSAAFQRTGMPVSSPPPRTSAFPKASVGAVAVRLSRGNSTVRTGDLPSVSSAPVTRSIVIRGVPRSDDSAAAVPAFVSPALPQAPAIVAPLAAPPPVAPEPAGRPAPAAPPAPSPSAPPAKDPLAPSDSGAARIPDSYRVGYAEYLRSATTGDLLMAALPGVAGIAGFTLVGAYAGFRQAKALQRALLAPVPSASCSERVV